MVAFLVSLGQWWGGQNTLEWCLPSPQVVEVAPTWKIYPNPATEHVTIEFQLKLPTRVIVKLLDPNGEQVRLLTNDLYPTGTHFIKTTLLSIPTGQYLIQCEYGDEMWAKRLVVK